MTFKPALRLLMLTLCIVPYTVHGQDDASGEKLSEASLGSTRFIHAFGDNLLCGQPSRADLAEAKPRGFRTVISLRTDGEINWDEAAEVRQLGMEFVSFPFRSPDALTDELMKSAIDVLADRRKQPFLLHCASANRVGAVWFAHRVIHDGIGVDAAMAEAKAVGLRSAGYEKKARSFVERHASQEASVKPGINDRFKDKNLDVSEWLGRFEIESREVYSARDKVLELCEIRPGQHLADIGAGTGFYSRLFASAVGDSGRVYAVDIVPRFLEHIRTKAKEERLTNLTTVLCSDRSVQLEPSSVDRVFICDTYHHFEYPQSTLASIHRALKPDGTLIVIDFEKIPGKSSDFIMGHVRAGKAIFQSEIISAGFRLVEEIDVPGFEENYFLRFAKQPE